MAVIPEALCEPRTLRLNRSLWVAAAVVAGLRQGVNDPIRRTERDRGQSKNFLNDLQGAIGELAAIVRIQADLPDATLRHSLVDFGGPVDDVDVIVEQQGGDVKVEAKALLLEPNKKWFLVNEIAYHRSLERGAHVLISTITSVGAGVARQSGAMPVSSLAGWDRLPFQYGDPAIGRRLTSVAPAEFGVAASKLRAVLTSRREEVVTGAELASAAGTARQCRQANYPSDLRPAGLIDSLVALLDRADR